MDEAFKAMVAANNDLASLMMARGFKMPSAAIEAKSGIDTARVCLNWAEPGADYANRYKFCYSETVTGALEKAQAWIMAQPTAEERAAQAALKLTAKALEAVREAGLDTGEGKALLARLEDLMARLSENIITDQSEAAI